jgi:hypothetical protein
MSAIVSNELAATDVRTSNGNRPLVLFLLVAFGVCWGMAFLFMAFSKYLVPIIGPLSLTHPLVILVLYSPSLAGLLVYYVFGGWRAVGRLMQKMMPRKNHAFWYLSIFLMFVLFGFYMRFASILFNQPVPAITLTVPQMVARGLWILIKETGLIGGVFGWIGFLLPFLQRKFHQRTVLAALLTGLISGLWLLPGYIMSSINQSDTSYLLYLLQLMIFVVFADIVFNATEGNLLLYVFMFWLAATGSHIQLYYFTRSTQLLEIVFFAAAAGVCAMIVKRAKLPSGVQTYPSFLPA